jgi:hypothetical protein
MNTALNGRIDTLQAETTERLTEVRVQIEEVVARLDRLGEDVTAIQDRIDPLVRGYYRVTLETERTDYATGELAEIAARVTDLEGNPLDLSVAANRPWVDFLTVWGQLKAVAGFQSRSGEGDRTISVQVNGEGTARVTLRAEHVEGFSDEAEEEVANALTARVSGQRTVAQMVLESNTPQEAKTGGAFRVLTGEYDRTDAVSVRSYVDSYYVQYGTKLTGRILPALTHRWRDYRSTVVAFAKADSDPRTPDQSRGTASIQVTFRDWIGPWIVLDYLAETAEITRNYRDRITGRITQNYGESLDFIKEEVEGIVRNKGLVGKQRDYQSLRDAMDQVNVSNPPPFMNTLVRSVKGAINTQQTVSAAQVMTVGLPAEEVAFQAITETSARADVSAAQVGGQIGAVEQQLAQVRQSVNAFTSQISNLQGSVGSLGGRLDALAAEGGEIQRIQSSVNAVSQLVGAFQAVNPTELQTKLARIEDLDFRVARIEGR